MLRITTLALATVLMGSSSLALAGKDSGFYVGGSVGTAQFDLSDDSHPDFGDIDFDDSDTSYKIFGGFNFGIIPLVDLAVEAAYIDFGSQDGLVGAVSSSVDSTGLSASGLAALNFGPFGVFAKMGMVNWDSDIGEFDESGTDPTYGLGARFQLGSLALRAEYETFELDKADIDFLSVGASFTF